MPGMTPLLALAAAFLTIHPQPRPLVENQAVMVANFHQIDRCDITALAEPEVLNSPKPVLRHRAAFKVSFLIGEDGTVTSPIFLMIENADEHEVLKVVKSWRFHPATCDGAPTTVEGIVTVARQ